MVFESKKIGLTSSLMPRVPETTTLVRMAQTAKRSNLRATMTTFGRAFVNLSGRAEVMRRDETRNAQNQDVSSSVLPNIRIREVTNPAFK